MNYEIYHPVKGYGTSTLNPFCQTENIIFQKVADVIADNIEEAFIKSQNDFSAKYRKLEIRSTSVGDIIKTEHNEYLMVKSLGFGQVPEMNLTIAEPETIKLL